MLRKIALGLVALVVVVMTGGASAFATDLGASSTGALTISGTPTMSFKTSPNVYAAYHSAGAGVANTSYVAGSMHSQGDRAYGVDPDYTGTYVQAITSAQASSGTVPNFPTTSAAASTGDFNTSNWAAK
jgi:hypothetical protein